MLADKRLFFLGAGSISEAMLKGILEAEVLPAEQITISNQRNSERLAQIGEIYGVCTSRQKSSEIATAGLAVLEQGELPSLFQRAVEQATRRATEMGQEISAIQPA